MHCSANIDDLLCRICYALKGKPCPYLSMLSRLSQLRRSSLMCLLCLFIPDPQNDWEQLHLCTCLVFPIFFFLVLSRQQSVETDMSNEPDLLFFNWTRVNVDTASTLRSSMNNWNASRLFPLKSPRQLTISNCWFSRFYLWQLQLLYRMEWKEVYQLIPDSGSDWWSCFFLILLDCYESLHFHSVAFAWPKCNCRHIKTRLL